MTVFIFIFIHSSVSLFFSILNFFNILSSISSSFDLLFCSGDVSLHSIIGVQFSLHHFMIVVVHLKQEAELTQTPHLQQSIFFILQELSSVLVFSARLNHTMPSKANNNIIFLITV